LEDATAIIRQQMVETRGQLSDKLQSLEDQVSDTVQSTGSVVTATAGAVQDTVESITGAVQDAVKSVTNAFDLQQQMEKHPWLVLGGSVVLGYLSREILEGPSAKNHPPRFAALSSAIKGTEQNGTNRMESAARANMQSAGQELSNARTAWDQITSAATVSIIGVLQDAASQVVPHVMNYLSRNEGHSASSLSNGAGQGIAHQESESAHGLT
jgi:hypothetical protein